MRLLLLTSEFPPGPGGIGTHASQVALHLTQFGWDTTVVTPQDYALDADIYAFNAQQPFRIVRLPSRQGTFAKALRRWRTLVQEIKLCKPDIILASGQRAVWLAAGLSWRFGLRLVAVGHGTEFAAGQTWQRALTRWAFQRAQAVVCVSHYTHRRMQEAGIQPRSPTVIHNGADAQRFRVLPAGEVRALREAHAPGADHLLLTVGNVTERKGHDIVIRALPTILERFSSTHYLVVGLPTCQKGLAELACQCGVGQHVHFLGYVEADLLVGYLNACDVFVMPSRHTPSGDFEGFGIAVVEAALCGKPAVVSNNSGLVEAVADGVTGLVVPEGDVDATAHAILTLLADPPRRMQMGQAARQYAACGQTWAHRAAQYHALLSGLLER